MTITKKVIITGATSGIGKELAIQLAAKGNLIGLIGRRTEKLQELATEIGEAAFYRTLDVTDFDKANKVYKELVDEMGGLDLMILNAGVGRSRVLPSWESDLNTINVNVSAFAHGMHFAFNYFRGQGHGHIVGMSSMAAHLASGRASAYTASKHFISTYMTGYRQKANTLKLDVTITDIRPGFVESEMTAETPNMFWVSTTQKAVSQMVRAIEKKKRRVYVTKRWGLLSWVARCIPQFVWDRLKF